MTPKETLLAAQLLSEASERAGLAVCNDWDFPESWSQKEREDFVAAFHQWNGDPEEFDSKRLRLPDYAVMDFIAFKLRKLAADQT